MAAAVTNPESAQLDVDLLEGKDAFLGLQRDWRRLTGDGSNPFLRWEWVSAWAAAFWRDAVLTAVVKQGGQTVAIAPFVERRYALLPGLSATCLQLLGPREVRFAFELPGIAGSVGDLPESLSAIVARLERARKWDWLELSDTLHAPGPVWQLVSRVPAGARWVPEASLPVPVMMLRRSWELQRSELRRNVKESIRHSYNSLRRENTEYALRIVEDAEEATAAVDTFLRLHALRAEMRDRLAHNNAFGGVALAAFLRTAAPALVDAGLLRIAQVVIRDVVVASRLVLDAGNARYLYYSGFDPAWWRFGVMTLLTAELVKDAIARGMARVNFSPGIDQSKVRWNVELDQVRSCYVVRSGPAALRLRALAARKRLSATVKRKPVLESAYFRMRRSLGI